MNIENLDEELVNFINKFFPNLNWEGQDSSAAADLILDEYGCIDWQLIEKIGEAIASTIDEDFDITIRPSTNKLILFYVD